jgi:hypothetical protein
MCQRPTPTSESGTHVAEVASLKTRAVAPAAPEREQALLGVTALAEKVRPRFRLVAASS